MSWWLKSQQDITRMLRVPSKREETVCNSFSLSVREDISQTEPVTLKPFIFHSFKHWLSWDSSLAHVCILAPRLASSSDIACLKIVHQDFSEKVEAKIMFCFSFFFVACNGRNMRLGSKPDSFGSSGDKSVHALKTPSLVSDVLFCSSHFMTWWKMIMWKCGIYRWCEVTSSLTKIPCRTKWRSNASGGW